jgi:hypothetical protein
MTGVNPGIAMDARITIRKTMVINSKAVVPRPSCLPDRMPLGKIMDLIMGRRRHFTPEDHSWPVRLPESPPMSRLKRPRVSPGLLETLRINEE